MKITKIDIPWSGFERKEDIKEIVIHATAGGGTLKYVQSGVRKSEYDKGIALFHYLISLDNNIYQILDDSRWCYHSSSSKHDSSTIAIEIEKSSKDNSSAPTDFQYEALNFLVSYLVKKHSKINSCVTHDYNAKKYSNRPPKPCCGAIDKNKLDFDLLGA